MVPCVGIFNQTYHSGKTFGGVSDRVNQLQQSLLTKLVTRQLLKSVPMDRELDHSASAGCPLSLCGLGDWLKTELGRRYCRSLYRAILWFCNFPARTFSQYVIPGERESLVLENARFSAGSGISQL